MLLLSTPAVDEPREKNFTIRLSTALVDAFDSLNDIADTRRKWIAHSAALLYFMSAPAEDRRRLMRLVGGTRTDSTAMDELIDQAKSGSFEHGGKTMRIAAAEHPPQEPPPRKGK